MTDVTVLEPDATRSDLKEDTSYLGVVNNVADFGVFVDLTPFHGTDLSGLVHKRNLPFATQPRDFSAGERVVVELDRIKDDGDIGLRMLYSEDHGDRQGPIPEDDHFRGAERDDGDLESAVEELRDLVERLTAEGDALEDPAADAMREIAAMRDRDDLEAVRYKRDIGRTRAAVSVLFESPDAE